VTGPNYGMPFTGTQIGLPGPPHIPLGGPACSSTTSTTTLRLRFRAQLRQSTCM
jgi:hypothetical protein